MEENNVELIDYLRVIWKRKILIITLTLVCIGVGVGVGVTNSRSKPKQPVTYHSTAVVKIGKKVILVPTSDVHSKVEYIEDPEELVKTFSLDYGFKLKETPGYHLDIEQVGRLAMIKLTLNGPDSGVERVLKELVDMLFDKHHKKAKDSVVAYNNFMKKTEADAELLKKDIFSMNKRIGGMKKKEEDYLMNIESGAVAKGDKTGGDRSAFLNMLYLKTIDKERELSASRTNLRNIQMRLTIQQITLGNLEEYKTEMVGEVSNAVVKPKEKRGDNNIAVAGVVGLIMSLFIVFFMEYIEGAKSRRKGQGQG
jgi:capsular polysaccharide biosynthesis protein